MVNISSFLAVLLVATPALSLVLPTTQELYGRDPVDSLSAIPATAASAIPGGIMPPTGTAHLHHHHHSHHPPTLTSRDLDAILEYLEARNSHDGTSFTEAIKSVTRNKVLDALGLPPQAAAAPVLSSRELEAREISLMHAIGDALETATLGKVHKALGLQAPVISSRDLEEFDYWY